MNQLRKDDSVQFAKGLSHLDCPVCNGLTHWAERNSITSWLFLLGARKSEGTKHGVCPTLALIEDFGKQFPHLNKLVYELKTRCNKLREGMFWVSAAQNPLNKSKSNNNRYYPEAHLSSTQFPALQVAIQMFQDIITSASSDLQSKITLHMEFLTNA